MDRLLSAGHKKFLPWLLSAFDETPSEANSVLSESSRICPHPLIRSYFFPKIPPMSHFSSLCRFCPLCPEIPSCWSLFIETDSSRPRWSQWPTNLVQTLAVTLPPLSLVPLQWSRITTVLRRKGDAECDEPSRNLVPGRCLVGARGSGDLDTDHLCL